MLSVLARRRRREVAIEAASTNMALNSFAQQDTVNLPKRSMWQGPTRQRYRGRLVRLGDDEHEEDDAQPLHRGSGGSTYTRKSARNTGSPKRGQVRG